MTTTDAPDAIAIFRPKDLERLKPFLDLDDESEDSDGLYAEPLEDGAVLVHTFQPFDVFEENPAEARAWLAQFGAALADVHDDPRGLFFFPDSSEPDATTYEAVIAEVANEGIWIATGLVDDDDEGLPPIDMDMLQAFAGQLLGPDGKGAPATSYDVGKLFENVQQQLLDALGVPNPLAGAPAEKGEVVDEEFEEEPPAEPKPKP
jgi:hypothetical protein